MYLNTLRIILYVYLILFLVIHLYLKLMALFSEPLKSKAFPFFLIRFNF